MQITPLFLILVLSAFTNCQSPSRLQETREVTQIEAPNPYTLIRDNLYQDSQGRLFLKSKTMEHFESGDWIAVWISHVYCDPCPTPDSDKEWELKDFVDTETFHHSKTDNSQGADIYLDRNFTYFHKWMADGGTVTVFRK